MEKPKSDLWDGIWVKESQVKEYKKKGYQDGRRVIILKQAHYNKMHEQVTKWYNEVFDYVTTWLEQNSMISLQKGSFSGGFCAVPVEDDTTKNWGAPLAKPYNKVCQIKEKFGRIVVYTYGLSKEEKNKLDKFEDDVSKMFDCCADFC
jgi:hypothetical protein